MAECAVAMKKVAKLFKGYLQRMQNKTGNDQAEENLILKIRGQFTF